MRHIRTGHPIVVREEVYNLPYLQLVEEDFYGSTYICSACGLGFDDDLLLQLHTQACFVPN
jgi:hypothetical protein